MIDSEFTRLLGSQIVQITLLAIVVWCVVKMVAKKPSAFGPCFVAAGFTEVPDASDLE